MPIQIDYSKAAVQKPTLTPQQRIVGGLAVGLSVAILLLLITATLWATMWLVVNLPA